MQDTSSSNTFQTKGLKVPRAGHNYIDIFIIVFNFITFLVTIFINIASSQPSLGIFSVPTGNISDKYPVDVTPAGWTFSTWGIIYTWQAAWLIYNIVLIFKKTEYGYLYREPPVLTRLFHLFIFANFCVNIAWLFVWEKEMFSLGLGLISLITVTLYAAIIISHKNIYDAEIYLARYKKYLWLYRVLVNNGLAFYATWVTIATSLNFAIAFTYEWGGNKSTASIVAISLVALIIFVYFALDVFFFEKYLRYTYSPYLQMAIAFAGVLSKNWYYRSPSAIIALCLIIIGPGIMFISKIIISIYRHKQSSFKGTFSYNTPKL